MGIFGYLKEKFKDDKVSFASHFLPPPDLKDSGKKATPKKRKRTAEQVEKEELKLQNWEKFSEVCA